MMKMIISLDNWWLATTSLQCAHSCVMWGAEFLVKHHITQVTQPPYNPDLVPHKFWLFPKLKSPLKGKRFSDHQWGSGKYDGAADGDWEKCVRSRGAYFEGDWGVIVLWTVFLVSSSINVSFFILCGWIPSGQNSYNTSLHIVILRGDCFH